MILFSDPGQKRQRLFQHPSADKRIGIAPHRHASGRISLPSLNQKRLPKGKRIRIYKLIVIDHLSRIHPMMEEKGYRGVDIDFEYILPEDRDAFTAFVRRTAEAVRAAGGRLSVALAPKTSRDPKGQFFSGDIPKTSKMIQDSWKNLGTPKNYQKK